MVVSLSVQRASMSVPNAFLFLFAKKRWMQTGASSTSWLLMNASALDKESRETSLSDVTSDDASGWCLGRCFLGFLFVFRRLLAFSGLLVALMFFLGLVKPGTDPTSGAAAAHTLLFMLRVMIGPKSDENTSQTICWLKLETMDFYQTKPRNLFKN
jgi:hypothetical protein